MAMNGPLQKARQLAMNPAAAAMMVAATRNKAESNAKTVAAERDKKNAEAKVTIDVGTGTLRAEGVPLDDFEKTMQSAYDKPYRELAAVKNRMAAEMQAKADEEQIAEAGNEWSGRVGPKISDIWRGKGRKTAMMRAKQLAETKRDAKFYGELAEAEEKEAKERETKQKGARGAIESSDLSDLTTDDVAVKSGLSAEEIESNPALTTAMKRQRDELTLKKAKESAGTRRKAVGDLKRDAVESGLTFDDWVADTEAQVGELTESERSLAKSKWTSFEKKITEETKKATRAEEDQAMQRKRFEVFVEKLSAGTKEKPAKISATEATFTEPEELVALRGQEGVDQTTLESAIRTRAGKITDELGKLERRRRSKRTLKTSGAIDPDVADAEIQEMTERIDQLREQQKTLAKPKDSLGIL